MSSDLKIYFAGSMRGGRNDIDIYYKIIENLKQYGQVLTEFVGDKTVDCEVAPVLDEISIHDRDVSMLEKCNCVIAEVTQPSLGVGYEIGRAVAMKKPVFCLYRPQQGKLLSAMIRGADNGSTFKVTDYNDVSEVPELLKNYLHLLNSL
ncbi:2p-deoxynucleoside 5p-phosphate N-hydrolase 1 [Biomphalaria glabrata]|uniref:Putative 2'-deoxynucleoside 5'-phosphate N-hydrolase 1 n=1 Tax=Biomphalaria glabrata TaxID=6526 RepID=A0A9W2Z2S9_BIOGL|nr:putative 2'-deoxynucleoside 5'-phosphate N-hydrolase 1 [Biomphalaria glabrata]XP_055869253.1 putative 2'-deoxynucleoside 5'-phosphate N-hydrolase 1 [Biomphalaria glabrata]KAI8750823.1 putative 2'-deoxynucleoside 5'-phosphate N-hydrolase 1 [Biomphalaria glabrata]